MEFSDISGAIESISALKNELAQAMVDIGTNSDKINSLIGSIDGILKNETVLNETIVDLQGKTDSIRDEIMSKLDESDESLKGINDAIVDIKDSLAQTTTESNEKISSLLKELEAINEKIVNKEDFKKELKKVEQHISSLNTEIDSTLQILSDLGAKVYDLDEEATALHLKNVEQDKRLDELKKGQESNRALISNNTLNIKETIEDLDEMHKKSMQNLADKIAGVKTALESKSSDNKEAIEKLTTAVEGLLIEDEYLSHRITDVLNTANEKIKKLQDTYVVSQIMLSVSVLAVLFLTIFL